MAYHCHPQNVLLLDFLRIHWFGNNSLYRNKNRRVQSATIIRGFVQDIAKSLELTLSRKQTGIQKTRHCYISLKL